MDSKSAIKAKGVYYCLMRIEALMTQKYKSDSIEGAGIRNVLTGIWRVCTRYDGMG